MKPTLSNPGQVQAHDRVKNGRIDSTDERVSTHVQPAVDPLELKLPPIPKIDVNVYEIVNPLTIYDHELLSNYVFRWLHPASRERGSMEHWSYVKGDMADAVRKCGIIPALVGGQSPDELIRNGDLVLGWMPRVVADSRNIFYERLNQRTMDGVRHQPEVNKSLKNGYGGRYLNQTGEVTTYRGLLDEEEL